MFLIDLYKPWLEILCVGADEGAKPIVGKKEWCEYKGRRYLVGASAFTNRAAAETKQLEACKYKLHYWRYYPNTPASFDVRARITQLETTKHHPQKEYHHVT